MSGGSIVNQWGASRGLTPELPEPGVLPLAVELNSGSSTGGGSGVPTAGNWLFAIPAWRQDAGSVPTIIYPSTVNVRDDVHNFWTPVQVVAPETGIVRTSVWMAPAARAPEFVFASPTAYQSALAVSVMEVTADVPWYSVAATATNYTNQGTAVTLSQDPASGLFSVGVIAYDLNSLTVTFTDSGWTEEAQVTASNAVDHTADLTLTPFTATTTGSSMTLAASGTGGNADWAEVLVTVHGVTDAIAFPYTLELENWPALVTEMATGEILNQNWTFNSGISPWTAQNNATVAASGLYPYGNSAGSMLITPDGVTASPGAASEAVAVTAGDVYQVTAVVTVPGGWAGGTQCGVNWLTSGGASLGSSLSPLTAVTGSQQELTAAATAPATAAKAEAVVQLSGTPSLVGAFFGGGMGTADFNAGNALWNSWTGSNVPVTRVYLASSYPYNTNMQEMVAAGCKMCISIQPPYNPVSSANLASLLSWLQTLQTAGAVCDIAIWSEPHYSGLTAAQYQEAVQYYGPAIRRFYPLVFVTSTGSVANNNENSFYPGDDQVDKVATDFYCASPSIGSTLDLAASPADSAVPPKPFGVWEFNGADDPVNGQTEAQITTFTGYIQSYMAGRAALGMPNADIMLFNSGSGSGWSNFLGNGSGEQAGFEGGNGTWTATLNDTIANSTAQAHSGSASMAMTSNASGNMQARSNLAGNYAAGLAVTPGQTIYGFAWFRGATSARSCGGGCAFYTSGGAAVSTLFGTTAADTTSGWTQVPFTITVPATAAWALGAVEVLGTGAAGEVHYVDDVSFAVIPASNDLSSTIEFSWDFRLPLWTAMYAALNSPALATPGAGVLTYAGYAALAIPGAFGAVPDDQLNWTDFSGRTITQAAARISRGIQYEQQSLEAGTLEIPLANNDGALTAGNQQSPYYPYAGQTDVPIRVRAIWPDSLTPYSVLYSGYTDDVKVQWSEETQYGYVVVTAADCWSRLTAQMLTAAQQEVLQDIPAGSSGALWTCNDQAGAVTAANTAPTAIPSLAVQISKFGNAGTSGGFGDTSIALVGDPGGTGWRLSGLTGTTGVNVGTSLIVFPPDPSVLPPPSGGVTVEFWVDIEAEVSSVNWNGVLAACIGANGPVWQLEIDAPTGADNGEISFIVFDKITYAATITLVNVGINWNTTVLFAVTFTQTTWAVYQDGALLDTGSCNFANAYNGYTFNGQCVPYQGLSGYCVNAVYHNIALYPGVLPQSRLISHYNVAFSAEQDEIDTSRVARVTGYGGFTPPLAMLGLFNEWPDAGVDPVTQITDTIGQVVSSYITNIASSTLAALFVDGPGALVYRRRNEWYDRAQGQWTLGEKASLPLNVNPYFGTSVTSWAATNAVLAWAAGQGQFGGSGAAQLTASGGGQVILDPETQPAAPGQQYSCVIAVMCPAGYAAGGLAQLVWINASNTVISRTSGNTVPLVAGAWTWLIVTGQAPAATAKLRGNFDSSGTPSNGTVFYVSSVLTTVYPGEVPYLRDVRLSDDRAQLFNTAILTQSGTNEQTTFSGTSLNFTPTSGIIVTAQNSASVAVRGGVPYTATVYLQNTAQTTPLVAFFTNDPGFTPTAFVPAEGCIEDLAQWIINTLGNPVLRGEQAVITPFATSGATRQAMTLALQAEVGDTVTLNRRPVGAPAVSLVMYLSNIQHDIDIRTGWTTTYQLSPAPTASILFTDDPSNGVLDGTSLLGF